MSWKQVLEDVPETCTPGDHTTFFFAYSNDFTAQLVSDAASVISTFFTFADSYYPQYKKFTRLANLRFDTRQPDDIDFHDNVAPFIASINSHLPSPVLGFLNSSRTGSDVIAGIQKFLTGSPLCGSTVLLLVKRDSDLQDVSNVVDKLRAHKVFVNVIESGQTSGGASSDPLYKISTGSNGFFVFNSDKNIGESVNQLMSYFLGYNLLYAADVKVIGNGSVSLPQVYIPLYKSSVTVNAGVSVQNHPLTDSFHNFTLTLRSRYNDRQMFYNGNVDSGTADFSSFGMYSADTWNVTLDYDYAKNTTGVAQIRLYTDERVDNYPPYSN
ncbi:unnamed protein product [Caenorhabditis sp. 36 PRJEB53466]|nr:unnamed protein product [Caenorhabditis sp. 36 PRJEB53466]